jgi:hypothetical protein
VPSDSSQLRPAYPARARLSQTDLAYRNLREAIVTREGAARLVEDGLVT